MRTSLLIALAGLVLPLAAAETKEPAFTVLNQADGYETRQYDTLVVASIEVRGNHSQSLNRGFRSLAGFIFGGNSGGQSIAMTAPVMQLETSQPGVADTDRRFKITFVMPDEFTIESLPKPNDADVRLHTLAPQRYAVIQFPGFGTEDNFKEHRAKLEAALKRDGIALAGEPLYAQYDEPWKPAASRRNEILWPLAETTVAPAETAPSDR